MKSLTRKQSEQINKMTISDKHKKLARKIARFVNNKNEYLKLNHDNPNTQFDLWFCSYSMSILRKDLDDFTTDIYFHDDSVSLEIGLSSKPDGTNEWFITHELFTLIYG